MSDFIFDNQVSLYEAVFYCYRNIRFAEQLEGRRLFPIIAPVVENNDPEFRRRVKIADPIFAGKLTSDWIRPLRVTKTNDPPIPNIYDTVLVLWIDGDSSKGYYLPIMNDINPSLFKGDPINDHREIITGDRKVEIERTDFLSVANDCNHTIKGQFDQIVNADMNTTVDGDRNIQVKNDENTRIDKQLDISCGESLTLRTDSGSFINLSSGGFVTIQDAFGRRITLGGFGVGGEWDLNNLPLKIKNATSVTINNKEIATVGAVDTDGDQIVNRGW